MASQSTHDTVATVLKLPWPPSVNMYWGHTARGGKVLTYLSERGRKFKDDVGLIVIQYRLRHRPNWPLVGRLQAMIELYPPAARDFDIDNFAKGVLDSLQASMVIQDDKQIDRLLLERREVYRPDGMVRVTLGDYRVRDEKFELIA